MHAALVGILPGMAWIGSFPLAWIRLHCSSHLPLQGDLWKEGRKGKNEEIYGNRGKKESAKGNLYIT